MSRVMSPNLTAPPDLRARTAEQARSATKRATAKANRRRSWPRWTGTALRMGSLAAAATVAAVMGLWLWQGGWIARTWADLNQRAIHLTVEAGLQVHEVLVEGRSETDAGQLMAALRIRRGDPILLFNPDGARAELERLPWVANATVERRLPDTIYVNLSERRPMALWQRDHKLALIDVDGVALTERALDRYSRLPILVG